MKLPLRFHRGLIGEKNKEAIQQQCALIEISCAAGVRKALQQFNGSLRKADVQGAAAAAERIRTLHTLSEEMKALVNAYLSESLTFEKTEEHHLPPAQYPVTIPVYCVSSMTLHECYRYLVQKKPGTNEEPEWMLAVTGLRIGPFLTLEHWLEFELAEQSWAQAAADMKAFTQLMLELDEYGQALHALFHSHRLNGPPRPSGIDMNLQETLEQASYPAIQAVFSQDGYVRFFARARPFEMLVYGQEIQKHGRFLYRLN